MPENNSRGFEIALNIRGKILRIRVWGNWGVEEFGQKYTIGLRDKLAHWKMWYVLVDVTRVSSQPEEVRSIIEKQLTAADEQRIKKIAYIRNGTGPRLPVKHARDGPLQAFFESADEALQWLLSEQGQIN